MFYVCIVFCLDMYNEVVKVMRYSFKEKAKIVDAFASRGVDNDVLGLDFVDFDDDYDDMDFF